MSLLVVLYALDKLEMTMAAWTRVRGVVVQGHRIASAIDGNSPFGASTIQLQKPLFLEKGIDLDDCYPGTLNVSVAPAVFTMLLQQPTCRGLKWHPDHGAENFFLSPCRVVFAGATYHGWVYYPDPATKEAHVHPGSVLEIVAPWILGVEYGANVELELNPVEVQVA